MSTRTTTVVDVETAGDERVAVRATALGGAQDVGAVDKLNLDGVAHAIESIANTLGGAIENAKPDKASVEFGLEIAVKGGKLVSLITEASGTATLNVTLEWGA
jgi:hypothetical protein